MEKGILFISMTVDDAGKVPYWDYFRAEPGVWWVAGAITDRDWHVEVVDADMVADEKIWDAIKTIDPEIVGFSCYTAGFPRALRFARQLKTAQRKIHTIFGGWHPSLDPNSVLKYECVDTVGVGQGERFINQFLEKPESFKNQIIRASTYPSIDRACKFRKPGDSFAQFTFFGTPPLESQRSATMVLTSGGCLFRCSYCCTPIVYGRGDGPRSIDLVLSEIESLISEHNVNSIFIRDEDPPVFKQFLEEFCDAMIRKGHNKSVRLFSFGDTRLMTRPLLEKMAHAGWIGLNYGVESFDRKQLKSLGRSPNLERIRDAFRWTQEAGIFATANLILWQPGDQIDCFERSASALRWLRPDEVIPLFFTPFPGTRDAIRFSGLPRRSNRLEDYHLLTPILQNDARVPDSELMELRRDMLNDYYLSSEYRDLMVFREAQFGDRFHSVTQVRRERLMRYGIDIWQLAREYHMV